jgi:hypothetical protein
MSMLDILKKLDSIENKKSLKESVVTECPPGMAGPAVPAAPSTPATLNISAGSAAEMAEILRALTNIDQITSPSVASPVVTNDGILGTAAGAGVGALAGGPLGAALGGVAGHELSKDREENEAFANEPDEEYRDHKFMTKDLSGGINRQKKMFKRSQPGDNAMAVESIKDRLYKALNEKKAKPDFLDMDKDGNKKEPMKKAIADKKKAPFKK